MRLILLEEYDERTMELARPIYDRHRRVLLAAGRKIYPKYVERLKQMDIRYVFVEDTVSEGITLEELLDMPSWIDVLTLLSNRLMRCVKKKNCRFVHLYAQICAIANEYENLISTEFVPPHEALEIIMARSSIRYRQQLVRLFVDTIPAYLPGTTVKMSDGRNAIVTKIVEHMQRPYVRYMDTHEEVSLVDHPSLLIVGQAIL